VIASVDGSITIFENGEEFRTYKVHAGPVTGISLHACGFILGSVGSDRSYVLYDLSSSSTKPVARVFVDSGMFSTCNLNKLTRIELTTCEFHPDGHIMAVGGSDGKIKILDIKTGQVATSFETDGPVQSLSFSENGTLLASASQGSTNVMIWDLRKQASTKTLDFGAAVSQIQWDYSAQFLAIVGGGAIGIQHFSKAKKSWTEILKKAIKSKKLAWDPLGQHLLVDSDKGIVEFKK